MGMYDNQNKIIHNIKPLLPLNSSVNIVEITESEKLPRLNISKQNVFIFKKKIVKLLIS